MEERIDLLISFFSYGIIPAAIVLIIHVRNRMKHKEKLAMTEKGLDPSTMGKEVNPLYQTLMWGTLLFGIGFGLLSGYLLSIVSNLDQNAIVPIMAILIGGISLIGFYIYKKHTENKKSK